MCKKWKQSNKGRPCWIPSNKLFFYIVQCTGSLHDNVQCTYCTLMIVPESILFRDPGNILGYSGEHCREPFQGTSKKITFEIKINNLYVSWKLEWLNVKTAVYFSLFEQNFYRCMLNVVFSYPLLQLVIPTIVQGSSSEYRATSALPLSPLYRKA